ncbi:hypothetical protein [Simonsiella muelleri]|uniref:hypothetical protein n=1 Tax=Simonsiella muelleri TaxID=72 RepID=UPI00059096BC|nr:hypothetical protein [Simonsiella muelleri]
MGTQPEKSANQKFSLARLAPHMGKLAGAKGRTAFGVERNGRLGKAGNGYAIRAFGNRTSAKPRGYFGQIERFWTQNGHNPK